MPSPFFRSTSTPQRISRRKSKLCRSLFSLSDPTTRPADHSAGPSFARCPLAACPFSSRDLRTVRPSDLACIRPQRIAILRTRNALSCSTRTELLLLGHLQEPETDEAVREWPVHGRGESRYPGLERRCRTRQQNKARIFSGLPHPHPRGRGGHSRLSHSSFHLMLQPRLGCCSLLTGSPATTAFRAARRSRPVTGMSLPGRLESS